MILMRQQQRAFREQLRIIALLRSRATTVAQCFKAMMKQDLLEPQVVEREEGAGGACCEAWEALQCGAWEAHACCRHMAREAHACCTHMARGCTCCCHLCGGAGRPPRIPCDMRSLCCRHKSAPLCRRAELARYSKAARAACHTSKSARVFPGCPSRQAGGSTVELYAGIEERAHSMLEVGDALKLQPKDFADRVIIALAGIMGNIGMVIAFCAAMTTWVALGPK